MNDKQVPKLVAEELRMEITILEIYPRRKYPVQNLTRFAPLPEWQSNIQVHRQKKY